jgi:hypothetical protein
MQSVGSRCVCKPHLARPSVSRDIVYIPNSKNTNVQIALCYNIPYLSDVRFNIACSFPDPGLDSCYHLIFHSVTEVDDSVTKFKYSSRLRISILIRSEKFILSITCVKVKHTYRLGRT